MRIHIGGDHAAYELHQSLAAHLRDAGHDVVDHGPARLRRRRTTTRSSCCGRPRPSRPTRARSASCSAARATASRSPPTRSRASARPWPTAPSSRTPAREHNNAQVVSIGARFTPDDVAKEIVDTFVATNFTDEARHSRRLGMVSAYENTGDLPALPESAAR